MGHGPLAVSCELHWEQLRESFGTGRTSFQTSLLKWTRRILQRIKYFLNLNLFFLLLHSTFCLDTKGGAKKSRQFDAVLFLGCIISSDELPVAAVT